MPGKPAWEEWWFSIRWSRLSGSRHTNHRRDNPLLCGTSIWIASRWNCSQSLSILRFLLSVNGIEEKWRRGNRAAKRQKTNMGIHPFWGNERCFICFSEAKRFPAIFPPALTFSLVLSLVLRQEKEHPHCRFRPKDPVGRGIFCELPLLQLLRTSVKDFSSSRRRRGSSK